MKVIDGRCVRHITGNARLRPGQHHLLDFRNLEHDHIHRGEGTAKAGGGPGAARKRNIQQQDSLLHCLCAAESIRQRCGLSSDPDPRLADQGFSNAVAHEPDL
jgi:hypothetical protein